MTSINLPASTMANKILLYSYAHLEVCLAQENQEPWHTWPSSGSWTTVPLQQNSCIEWWHGATFQNLLTNTWRKQLHMDTSKGHARDITTNQTKALMCSNKHTKCHMNTIQRPSRQTKPHEKEGNQHESTPCWFRWRKWRYLFEILEDFVVIELLLEALNCR